MTSNQNPILKMVNLKSFKKDLPKSIIRKNVSTAITKTTDNTFRIKVIILNRQN